MRNWIKAVGVASLPFIAMGLFFVLAAAFPKVVISFAITLVVFVVLVMFLGMTKDAKKWFDRKERREN